MNPSATSARALLLTPSGAAAIAVVRIAGAGVGPFLGAHFSRAPKPGRCVHGELRDGERVLDDPVVVLHDGGQAADINLHGGPWVVASVIELLRRAGFEIIEAREGELPPEAVDAGAEEEVWREVLAHVPLAPTEQALRVLLAQPAAWSRGTPKLEDESLWWLLHPPRVAIVGPPNVGKSTLANQLFAQRRSITADLPGTTRDWVGEMANIDGLAVMLVDTPGVRDTSDAIERSAIERSAAEVQRADLVVLVLDASVSISVESRALLDRHHDAVVLLNKSDLAVGNSGNGIRTVATTGQGVDRVRMAIRKRFGCESFDEQRAQWWTKRQREQLRKLSS